MKISNFDEWHKNILAVRNPSNFTEAQTFSSLLELSEGNTDLNTAKVLFSLLTDVEDHGLKQSVVSMLSAFSVYVYYKALICDLPRMLAECKKKDWPFAVTDYLARNIVDSDLNEIIKAFNEADNSQQKAFLKVIKSRDFFHEHIWVNKLLDRI